MFEGCSFLYGAEGTFNYLVAQIPSLVSNDSPVYAFVHGGTEGEARARILFLH